MYFFTRIMKFVTTGLRWLYNRIEQFYEGKVCQQLILIIASCIVRMRGRGTLPTLAMEWKFSVGKEVIILMLQLCQIQIPLRGQQGSVSGWFLLPRLWLPLEELVLGLVLPCHVKEDKPPLPCHSTVAVPNLVLDTVQVCLAAKHNHIKKSVD